MSSEVERVRLAHGGGGRLMRDLVRDVFAAAFAEGGADAVLEDAAVLQPPAGSRLAFTTDTFVVHPTVFPGGDLGDLAINGTVNDLATRGAKPLWLSVAMILEEGLPIDFLRRIVTSMAAAATAADVRVVTGDTKVVPHGQADKLYINTTGVGVVPDGVDLSASRLTPGDRVLISGPIGDHGIAVMSRREGLAFEADVISDTAPLADLVASMLAASSQLHTVRDPTRGGLATVVCELAEDSGVSIDLEETAIPVRPTVRAACETLGFDPLHVPCEGRLVAACGAEDADAVLDAMNNHPQGQGAAIIGHVRADPRAEVVLHTRVGGARLVDLPAGELLPRIC